MANPIYIKPCFFSDLSPPLSLESEILPTRVVRGDNQKLNNNIK